MKDRFRLRPVFLGAARCGRSNELNPHGTSIESLECAAPDHPTTLQITTSLFGINLTVGPAAATVQYQPPSSLEVLASYPCGFPNTTIV